MKLLILAVLLILAAMIAVLTLSEARAEAEPPETVSSATVSSDGKSVTVKLSGTVTGRGKDEPDVAPVVDAFHLVIDGVGWDFKNVMVSDSTIVLSQVSSGIDRCGSGCVLPLRDMTLHLERPGFFLSGGMPLDDGPWPVIDNRDPPKAPAPPPRPSSKLELFDNTHNGEPVQEVGIVQGGEATYSKHAYCNELWAKVTRSKDPVPYRTYNDHCVNREGPGQALRRSSASATGMQR